MRYYIKEFEEAKKMLDYALSSFKKTKEDKMATSAKMEKCEPVVDRLINLYERVYSLSRYLCGEEEKTGDTDEAPIKPITWIFDLLTSIDYNLGLIEEEVKKLK